MTHLKRRLALAALLCAGAYSALDATPAAAWNRGDVETFAVLPNGAPKIEGLTVRDDGNVYVSTFDPTATLPASNSAIRVLIRVRLPCYRRPSCSCRSGC